MDRKKRNSMVIVLFLFCCHCVNGTKNREYLYIKHIGRI
ncbi:hypothetical protein CLOBOL_07315 [Enterocloster bolteae ATCC BAA-613]|uniref:Uncharacterized protein n=1 Tax=Enterocloster bolteae (strain ATCC BAA-613 / DSM 15670 / CCUG 46953 / JCM 12243 / WAL 16351) TaxID=411902 RepID=A8S5T9_ENTBW|nr:hypothetical protein CLOBOL_07315 [Enterocloster bolteae ATCC BAA-613]